MYVVNLLLCICSWLQWYGTYRVMKTYFVFAASLSVVSEPSCPFFVPYMRFMPLSWTFVVIFDFPVS